MGTLLNRTHPGGLIVRFKTRPAALASSGVVSMRLIFVIGVVCVPLRAVWLNMAFLATLVTGELRVVALWCWLRICVALEFGIEFLLKGIKLCHNCSIVIGLFV